MTLDIDGSEPLSYELVSALTAFIDRAEDAGAEQVAVLHVTGAPASRSPYADADIHLVNKWERTLRRLERLGALTVAVADGDCGGVALDVLLATDFRPATDDVRLCPSAWPGMALYRLANGVGAARMRKSVLFGTPIPVRVALELDLVDELVEDVPAGIAAAMRLIGALSGPDLAIRRQLMLDATTTSFEEALGRHLAACDRELRKTDGVQAA